MLSRKHQQTTPTIHKYSNQPKLKDTLRIIAVILRAALLGLTSDAPGHRVMTGTAAPTRRKGRR